MAKIAFAVLGLLLAGILGFNSLFGTPQEKKTSREIIGQVHELSVDVFTLLKSEKEKFDEGKYHEALADVKTALGLEHERAEAMGESGHECLEECEHLEEQEHELEIRLDEIARLPEAEREDAARQLREEILQLASAAEQLAAHLE